MFLLILPGHEPISELTISKALFNTLHHSACIMCSSSAHPLIQDKWCFSDYMRTSAGAYPNLGTSQITCTVGCMKPFFHTSKCIWMDKGIYIYILAHSKRIFLLVVEIA